MTVNKRPGVSLVNGVGTWRRLFAKFFLRITVTKAINFFRDDQLCAGLRAGIDRSVYEVQALWENNTSRNNWGFLLVDATKCVQFDNPNCNP